MTQVLTPTLQRKRNFRLRKTRELSLAGTLLVKEGDEVSSNQAVAKAELPGDMIILRVPEHLGIDAEDALNSLLVKNGDSVTPGHLICEYKGLFGWFKNSFLSDRAGVIEFINKETCHIGLRLPSHTIQLDAYIQGKVVAIENRKSVTIETACTFIQGIFGVGGEKHGKLKELNVKQGDRVTVNDIPQEIKGCILFGGTSPDSEALKKAALGGATGFITGSIDDRSLAEYLGYDIGIALTGNEKLDMTLILTEGFGKLSFSDTALTLLTECAGLEASINGATQVRAGALRPEIIISDVKQNVAVTLNAIQEAEAKLDIGSNVRIIREPYFGIHAKVLEMPFKPEMIESGSEVRVLKAQVSDGKVITVPRANVEIL